MKKLIVMFFAAFLLCLSAQNLQVKKGEALLNFYASGRQNLAVACQVADKNFSRGDLENGRRALEQAKSILGAVQAIQKAMAKQAPAVRAEATSATGNLSKDLVSIAMALELGATESINWESWIDQKSKTYNTVTVAAAK